MSWVQQPCLQKQTNRNRYKKLLLYMYFVSFEHKNYTVNCVLFAGGVTLQNRTYFIHDMNCVWDETPCVDTLRMIAKKYLIHVCIAWSVECVAWSSVWVMAWSSRVINRKFHQITLIRNITLNHTLTQFRILFDSCIDCTIHCAQ